MRAAHLRVRQALGEALYATGKRRPAPSSLSVLMYHAVTPDSFEDATQESIPAALFGLHMASLRGLGVEVLSLEDGLARLAAGTRAGSAVSVVFDDGYAGVHDYALEALVEYRIPATVFLATEWIGRPAFPWADPALGRPLSWRQVSTLVDTASCSVGSHTHTHSVLTALESEAVRNELRRSRAAIQEHVGVAPRLFAYPYGSYGTFNARTRRILIDEGFSAAVTTVWGRHRPGDDPLEVKRIRVSWCDTVHEIKKALAGCYDWYRVIQRVQASRSVLQGTVGN